MGPPGKKVYPSHAASVSGESLDKWDFTKKSYLTRDLGLNYTKITKHKCPQNINSHKAESDITLLCCSG